MLLKFFILRENVFYILKIFVFGFKVFYFELLLAPVNCQNYLKKWYFKMAMI